MSPVAPTGFAASARVEFLAAVFISAWQVCAQSRLSPRSLPHAARSRRFGRGLVAGLVMPLLACGCGGDFATVKGRVLLDGKPLRDATVAFYPEQGRGSLGRTDDEGRYELKYTHKQAGVRPGPCKVQITTAEDERKEVLPAKYHAASELTEVVKPGVNEFNFSLSSK